MTATSQATHGPGPLLAPSGVARVTQIALLLNAAMATIAAVVFVLGAAPHAAEEPTLARIVAAGHVSGAFMLVFVALRVRRDASLIALPIAFVFCNLVAHVHELLVRRDTTDLPPLVVETLFLSIYSVCVAAHLRARRGR